MATAGDHALSGLTALTTIVLAGALALVPAVRGTLISSTPLSYSALMSLSLMPLGSEAQGHMSRIDWDQPTAHGGANGPPPWGSLGTAGETFR